MRENYEDALVALWLKREAGEWEGRFWFQTFTYRVDEGENLGDALVKVQKAYGKLARWMLLRYGAENGGTFASSEIGPKGLKEGQVTQVHVHALIALDSLKQIGAYRYVVGRESGLIERVDFDAEGDVEKQRIESEWVKLIGRDCPVSRFFEVAPGGLPLQVDKDAVTESLKRLGFSDTDKKSKKKLEKCVRYNTRATIKSTCSELLKYVTKAYRLSPDALADVIIAFNHKRRVWSSGLFYGKKRSDVDGRTGLVQYLEDWVASHGGEHPIGERRCRCEFCSKCGGQLGLESAWSVAMRDSTGLADALAAYMDRRGWLDTASKSVPIPSNRAPPGLASWLRSFYAPQSQPKPVRVINL